MTHEEIRTRYPNAFRAVLLHEELVFPFTVGLEEKMKEFPTEEIIKRFIRSAEQAKEGVPEADVMGPAMQAEMRHPDFAQYINDKLGRPNNKEQA